MPEQIDKEIVDTAFKIIHLTLLTKCIKKKEPASYGCKELCDQIRQWDNNHLKINNSKVLIVIKSKAVTRTDKTEPFMICFRSKAGDL